MVSKTTTTAPMPASPIELLTIAPQDLIVRDQARADATPDDELVASVRQHGIIQPPVVEQHEDGYVILAGHRRVGAAILAGLPTITCILRSTPLDSAALTLEQQIVENERRKGLTAKDLVAGYQRLALFGLRPEDIAASLGEKPERVRAGLKVTESAKASALIEKEPSIDFEQAASIAEFDEHPKLQSKLIETATTRPENFRRDLESARKDRLVEDRVAELKAQLKADGVKLADVTPYDSSSWWTGKGVSTGDGKTLERLGLTPEEHATCPGHAAVIHRAQTYYLDREDGIGLVYVCTDWQGNGHEIPDPQSRARTPEEIAEDEAREQRRAEWAQQQAERDRQRELIAANTTARHTWIRGYLTGGRLRPTAQHFELIADALAAIIDGHDGIPTHTVVNLLTGSELRGWSDDADEQYVHLISSHTVQPLRVIVATALAVFEDAIGTRAALNYFTVLESFGYTLTDTDREHIAAAVDDDVWTTLAAIDDQVDGGDEDEDEVEA